MSEKTSTNLSEPMKTILCDLHKELGGRMVDFAGWYMPVQFAAGIMSEHKHTRTNASLFDVSHMGQLELRGPSADHALEALVPADIVNLPVGKSRYTFFTNDKGGILDDLIVTRAEDHLYLVINASMRDQDIAHLREHLDDVDINVLQQQALIAVQGPKAIDVVSMHCPESSSLSFMQSTMASINEVPSRVSRLGYTGEDGFELSVPVEHAESIARLLLSHEDCMPAGLGARDSLRLEAGLCLYGNDIDNATTPVEAGLTWAIQKRRREQGGFAGYDIISEQIRRGPAKARVGILPEGRTPVRQGAVISDTSDRVIGVITSGGFGPTVGGPVAMGYVETAHSTIGSQVMVSVRGKQHLAMVAELPFVPPGYKR